MNRAPLRRNRDFVLLQLGQGLSTLAPSIRNAPSLSELDEPGRPATMEA